ncbi:MAG: hypothetical protein WC953_11040 [Pseudomonas sp.]
MATFEVAFHGQVQPGVDAAQARTRIGQLFQVGDQQLDMLFSGRRIVIKQGLDEAAAEKYRQAIERAGALCEINQIVAEPSTPPAVSESVAAPDSQPATSRLVPRDEYMAAFVDVEAPNLPLAPLGADMQDSYSDFAPLDIDLSSFTLAPPGSDLEQLPSAPPPSAPDTSHLRLIDDK